MNQEVVAEPPADSAARHFGDLVRERSVVLGVEVTTTFKAVASSINGGYFVQVAGDVDLLFEVDDWVQGVRVMDPHGEDVTVEQAVDYFAARAVGQTRDQAERLAFHR